MNSRLLCDRRVFHIHRLSRHGLSPSFRLRLQPSTYHLIFLQIVHHPDAGFDRFHAHYG
jgi:hypothetical protein